MSKQLKTIVMLLGILLMAGALRWVGLNWDDFVDLSHPDEHFVNTITHKVGEKEYLRDEVKSRCADDPDPDNFFNTQCTPYNPNNVNSGSFAYGTLPVFMVSAVSDFAADVLDQPGLTEAEQIHVVGRTVNILAELITIIFVFLIGRQLFSVRAGLLAAMLYGAAVLPIQLTHFWTVDIIGNMWFTIALFLSVLISQNAGRWWPYPLFGIALGAAMASRVNLAPAAILAPIAAFIYLRPRFPIQLPEDKLERRAYLSRIAAIIFLLMVAALSTVLVFRVGQPYAFAGPGFFDFVDWPNVFEINWNEKWRDDLDVVGDYARDQNDGWPPSHQWVNRIPYLYPWMNMSIWGLGAVLGVVATFALLAALFKQVRAERLFPTVGLLSAWIVLYFAWQGQLHFMTMRYYLPLYAPLCLLAAWGLTQLRLPQKRVLTGAVVGATFLWALMFTGIYRTPQTRVSAAEWINRQLPATVMGLHDDGSMTPLSVGYPNPGPGAFLDNRYQMLTIFSEEVYPPGYTEDARLSSANISIREPVTIEGLWFRWNEPSSINVELSLIRVVPGGDDYRVKQFYFTSSDPYEIHVKLDKKEQLLLKPGRYRWVLDVDFLGTAHAARIIPGIEWVTATGGRGTSAIPVRNQYSPVSYFHLSSDDYVELEVFEKQQITGFYLPHQIGEPSNLVLHTSNTRITATPGDSENPYDILGYGQWYDLKQPVTLQPDTDIRLYAKNPLLITGSAIATEGNWELSTPSATCWRRVALAIGEIDFEDCRTYAPFSEGRFTELPLQMVEHDRPKWYLYRLDILEKADYLTMTTNRMYDGLTRNEPFFANVIVYYEELFGEDLGYEQIARFEDFPHLGPITLRDQVLPDDDLPDWLNEFEAEEAFHVYDHPTIYVYQNQNFSIDTMPFYFEYEDERNRIDLDELEEPTYDISVGAYSENELWLIVAGWVLAFYALNWLTFPLMFTLFPKLPLRGYVFGRGVGWLLLALVPWWLTAALELPFWRQSTLLLVVIAFIGLNLAIGWRRRREILPYIRQHWKAMLAIELLWLAAFAFGTLLRGVNPDYWHQWRGGEKPMDLAYLNATLRTEEFAPPNPWLAGFSINYYYFGFVIAGMPLKLMAIPPEIGPNLFLATLYATLAVNVFGLAWSAIHLISRRWYSRQTLEDEADENSDEPDTQPDEGRSRSSPNWKTRILNTLGDIPARVFNFIWDTIAGAGGWAYRHLDLIFAFTGLLYVMVLGNWGTVVMDESLDLPIQSWYWDPTRIIAEDAQGGGIIHEMPVFSFLYGDPHAHTIALLPVTMLLLALLALVAQRQFWWIAISGALLGIIYMTNSWDILVYVPLIVGVWWFASRSLQNWLLGLFAVAIGGVVVLFPYLRDFTLSQSGRIALYEGERSLLDRFVQVWGTPLAVAGLWIAHRFKVTFLPNPNIPAKLGFLVLLGLTGIMLGGQNGTYLLVATALMGLVAMGFQVVSVQLILLIIFAAVPDAVGGQDGTTLLLAMLLVPTLLLATWDGKMRFAHLGLAFFLGGLLAIEHIVFNVDGPESRMNTGFKVYYQLWLWAGLLMPLLIYHMFKARQAYIQVTVALALFLPLFLYPIRAIPARATGPTETEPGETHTDYFTLNGYAFMENMEIIADQEQTYSIAGDRELFAYLRDNIEDYPVIAEAAGFPCGGNYCRTYYWHSRVASYTGLPTVIGWRHHLGQQYPHQILELDRRAADMERFYSSEDPAEILDIIREYDIDYVVYGTLERYVSAERNEIAMETLVEQGVLRIEYQRENTRLYKVIY
jgi:YYY domain-containing protein